MRFVVIMGLREARAAWKRLLFFFICIAVGVGSIVALRSVIQSVRQVIGGEARTLLAADLMISTDRPWTPEAQAAIATRLEAVPVADRTESIELATMARPRAAGARVARMVELRAIQPAFPFYGAITLQDGTPYSHQLLQGFGTLVRPELLTQLGLTVGDQIVIGDQAFVIRGVIATEAGRNPGAFSLGSRVLIDFDALEATGLLQQGSRARRQVLVKIEEARLEATEAELQADLEGAFVRVRSFRATEDRIGDNLMRAENYLSLIGLVVVILGGISVSSVMRVFVQQKIKTIAVVKCVGASTRQILSVYLLQAVVLGLAGSLLGVLLAEVGVRALPDDLVQYASVPVEVGLTPSAVIQGVGIGVLVAVLFSLVPLLDVRHVRPALLLRQDLRRPGRDWVRLAAIGLVGSALVALAAWQAASLRVGVTVSGGFVAVAAVLQATGAALIWMTSSLARARWFPLRQAVLHLSRPGNQTRVILLAVGLGAFFIIGVRTLQGSLLQEFDLQVGDNAPDMFLLDIQRDQADEVRRFFSARVPHLAETGPTLIPVLRARVTALRGARLNLETVEDVRGRGLGREYTVTYRSSVQDNERIVAGRFFDPAEPLGDAAVTEVSVATEVAERFGIGLDDRLEFDVLGRTFEAIVTSIRQVEWEDASAGGFMFVFSPATFADAPHTFIAPVRTLDDPAARGALQHDLVERFPNVSVIDVREVLESVRAVLDMVTLAVTMVGGLVLGAGVLILIGSVAMTKFQRVYEAAVFKTLGARARDITALIVIEYGLLGGVAGTVGALCAVVLTWAISEWALDIPWRISPLENLSGALLTSVLVMAVGLLASLDVLRRKPLATLRTE